ncbi:MAG TPA: ISL3 family transposase [Terriglobales bacterium]|nr:ISL3 family transposase [Terriglobales bacterium]
MTVHVQQKVSCPECGSPSRSRHSHYLRKLQDLPWQGMPVQIRLCVRRFRCRNPDCKRTVFAERLPGIARPYGRRTDRVHSIVSFVGYSAGGLPASRILQRLAIPISDDTVLRAVKQAANSPPNEEPIRHLGVDDWAWRKGQRYGTILVDLQRHRVRELLPDRSAETFETWLRKHPTVETINRDRCGLYAEGGLAGAPEAMQIADRFHLILNLSTAVERSLEEHRKELEASNVPIAAEPVSALPKKITAEQLRQQQRRQRRLERYEKVIELHGLGLSQKAISAALGLGRKTIRRWLRAGQFPERKPVVGRHSHVCQFDEYLRQRWAEGCTNATTLFHEIRGRGYRGSRQMVNRHVTPWRHRAPSLTAKRPQVVSPKQAAMLLCKRPEHWSLEQKETLDRLVKVSPVVHSLYFWVLEFREAIEAKEADRIRDWIRDATSSRITPLVRFAHGLRRDMRAVMAAVESHWSSGQVEGQINRLKSIKRQMYGRAGFTLLRARVLPFTAPGPAP